MWYAESCLGPGYDRYLEQRVNPLLAKFGDKGNLQVVDARSREDFDEQTLAPVLSKMEELLESAHTGAENPAAAISLVRGTTDELPNLLN